jgi:hypothetical protein
LDGNWNYIKICSFIKDKVECTLYNQNLHTKAKLLMAAASIDGLCINHDDFMMGLHRGGFGYYCPVNLIDKNEYVKIDISCDNIFAAEYDVTLLNWQ